jgi:peptide/nickel transport system ATP-binding protein
MMRLQAEMGLAFLFISHDIAVVARISHPIAVMYLGEIVEIGPRASIIENPQHPYTRKLMVAAPTADPARRGFRLGISNEEPPSPIRTVDSRPAPRRFRQVAPAHLVQEIAV